MTGRTRGKKPVNYKALDGDDSDDDFNTSTPPTKRARTQRGAEREAEFAGGAGPSSARPSRDEKLFKKQLMIALEMSKVEPQSASESSQEHSVRSADTVPVSQDDLPPSPRTATSSQQSTSQDSGGQEAEWAADSGSSAEEDSGDDSDFSEEEFKTKKKKPAAKTVKTKPASKKKTPAVKSPASGNPSAGRVSKTTKKQSWAAPPRLSPAAEPVTPVTGAEPPPVLQPVSGPVKSPPTSRSRAPAAKPPKAAAPSRPALTVVNAAPAPRAAPPRATGANLAAESRTTQKWKPPARVGSDTPEQRIVSPSGGGLRLGLSRNRKFKPLHPSARSVQ